MKKFLKVLLIVFFIASVCAVIIFFAAKSILSEEKLKMYIADAADKYIGRQVQYDSLSFNFIGITLQNFSVSENESFGGESFAKIGDVVIKVEILPLFRKKIQVSKIGIERLSVNIIKDKDGRFSFEDMLKRFEDTSKPDSVSKADTPAAGNADVSAAKLPDLILNKAYIKDSVIFFEDRQNAMSAEIKNININIDGFKFDGRFLCDAALDLKYNTKDINLEIPFKAVLSADLKDFDPEKMSFNLSSLNLSSGKMSVSGKASVSGITAPEIIAEVNIAGLNSEQLGQFVKDIPSFNVSRIELSSKVKLNTESGSAVFDELSLNIAGSKIDAKGNVDWKDDLKYDLKINFDLMAEALAGIVPEMTGDFSPKGHFSGIADAVNDSITADISVKGLSAAFDPAQAKNKKMAESIFKFKLNGADLDMSVSADLKTKKAEIKKANMKMSDSEIKASGLFGWGKDIKYDLKADLNISLDNLSSAIPDITDDFSPKGNIRGTVLAKDDIIKGDIKAQMLAAKFEPAAAKNKAYSEMGLPKFAVSGANLNSSFTLDLKSSLATLKSISLSIEESKASASGTLNWKKDLQYELKTDLNFMLELLSRIIPDLVKDFEPKGKIKANASLSHKLIKAEANAENVSFKYEPLFSADKINASVTVNGIDNIKLSGLSGLLNGKKFSGAADYLKTRTALNVNMKFDMEALVLKAFPQAQPSAAAVSENKPAASAESSAASLPLNLNAELKAGQIQMPHFYCEKGAVINAKLTGVTDKLDMVNGDIAFNVSAGSIEDIDKLAQSNKIAKIAFTSLNAVNNVLKMLKVGGAGGYSGRLNFDSFIGAFKFVDGKMTINTMDFKSKTLTMNVKGTTDFKKDKLDMRADVYPGQNKPVVVKISGTTDKPKGSIDIASSAVSIFGEDSAIGKIGAALGGKADGGAVKSSEPASSRSDGSVNQPRQTQQSSPAQSETSTGDNKKNNAEELINLIDGLFNKKH